ncbi:nitrate reductase molybdenum cofactor assembly chaperone [Luteithermobacter gelatinilyticus]|uniref:nitrate reductase molybdenum cofactor assembly chaperone n=1 Tax=Luteithermobacter gelatinilyticus TaxID=2582913 RepID=UPI001106506B|nr:nitrate reductase molybdenum cofactor assembly chaperone [Luteithermobacter gelatinilyticus]
MMRTFKVLGLLLTYPHEELQQHMAEMKTILVDEGLIPEKIRKPLFVFMDDLARHDILSIQEEYVSLFDRGRSHSLYLFEHVHGESRDRGPAMVDLMEYYARQGFRIAANELPDYLPLFLEFLSVSPFAEAQELLGDTVHIIATIGAKMKVKGSSYRHVFRALEALSSVKVDKKIVQQAMDDAAREDTSLEALDREWEEAPAFDGTDTADCNLCPQVTRHRAGRSGASSPHHS